MKDLQITHRNAFSLLWAAPYLLSGVFSHWLNDPVNHAVYVWLPSGVAVGAYLLTRRRDWPLLLAAFFCAQLIMTGFQRAEPGTALAFAIAASASSVLAAWTIRRLAPHDGGPGFVGALLAGALVGAACSVLIGGSWLWLTHDLHTWTRLRNWGAAYLAGVLILAPALTGWAHFRPRRSGGPRMRDLVLGSVAYVALVASALLSFNSDVSASVPYAVTFELTYLPLTFSVLIALVWGPPGGTLAVVTLTFMALFLSSQGKGPFVDPDSHWHALLATQVYLIVTALLVLLVNTLRGERAQRLESAERWRGRFELSLAGSRQLMYRYTPTDGAFEVSGGLQEALGIPASALSSLDRMMALVHPDDRARLGLHWAARRANAQDRTPFLFRLAHAKGGWRIISDRGSPLTDADGSVAVVAGMWRLGEVEQADVQ